MKWELKSHSYQIADTGDYDGCHEITDGKISILTKDDDVDDLLPIIDALNNSGCDFYLPDAVEYENNILKIELSELREQVRKLRDGLQELFEQYESECKIYADRAHVPLEKWVEDLPTYQKAKQLLKETE